MRVDQLISDWQIERLMFLGRVMSDAQWEIGRMTISILEAIDHHNAKAKSPDEHIGYMNVYRFVSEMTGKRDRSIRRYVAVCKFFGPTTVEEFDILPFEYFAEAMSYPMRWREMLEATVRAMDDRGGKIPGVNWMINLISPTNYDDRAQELSSLPIDFNERIERDAYEYETTQDVMPESVQQLKARETQLYSARDAAGLLSPIHKVVEMIKNQISMLPISTESKRPILIMIDNLVCEIDEIKKGLEMPDTVDT